MVALRRVDKLNSILEVAKAMTVQRDIETLLPTILREAARVVEAERCSLFILDREKNELWSRIAPGHHRRDSRPPRQRHRRRGRAERPDRQHSRRVRMTPASTAASTSPTNFRTKSILCAPMRDARGDVTGVIQALNAASGEFDSEDEELLLALGGQAASAIENALLKRRDRQRSSKASSRPRSSPSKRATRPRPATRAASRSSPCSSRRRPSTSRAAITPA